MKNKTEAWRRGHADGREGKPIDAKRFGPSKGTGTQLQEIDYKIGHEAGTRERNITITRVR